MPELPDVEVYRQYLDPKQNTEHRRWRDTYLDLGSFAGQTVNLHFVTLPGPAGDERYDWGGWSAPVLIAPDLNGQDGDGRN